MNCSAHRFAPLVFPGIRSRVRSMRENAVNAALRRLGYTKAEMTGPRLPLELFGTTGIHRSLSTGSRRAACLRCIVSGAAAHGIPNLRRFPRMGRRYMDQPPQSAEGITQLGLLPAGAADALRVLSSGDHLILYTEEQASATVHLLSIRHHRQLSFDFTRLWPGQRGEGE